MRFRGHGGLCSDRVENRAAHARIRASNRWYVTRLDQPVISDRVSELIGNVTDVFAPIYLCATFC
jgi:hypothetical protein